MELSLSSEKMNENLNKNETVKSGSLSDHDLLSSDCEIDISSFPNPAKKMKIASEEIEQCNVEATSPKEITDEVKSVCNAESEPVINDSNMAVDNSLTLNDSDEMPEVNSEIKCLNTSVTNNTSSATFEVSDCESHVKSSTDELNSVNEDTGDVHKTDTESKNNKCNENFINDGKLNEDPTCIEKHVNKNSADTVTAATSCSDDDSTLAVSSEQSDDKISSLSTRTESDKVLCSESNDSNPDLICSKNTSDDDIEEDKSGKNGDESYVECLGNLNDTAYETQNKTTGNIESISKSVLINNGTNLTTSKEVLEDLVSKVCCRYNADVEELPLEKLSETSEIQNFKRAEEYNREKKNSNLEKCVEDVLENSVDPLAHSSVSTVFSENSQSIEKASNDIDKTSMSNKAESDLTDSLSFIEIPKEETGFPAVFEGAVVIGKYISVKGDFTLKSSEALIESPSLVAPFLLKEPDKFPPKEKEEKSEAKSFFHTTAGEFLIGLGLSRVNEYFHRDMSRIKARQIKRNGKSAQLEQELQLHQNFYLQAKKANEPFVFPYKACKFCNFVTESSIILEGHLLVPHVTARREYQCNFCNVVNRDPREMLAHMERVHGKFGRIQPPLVLYECPYCIFESNSKVKLNSHLNKCLKYFDRGTNQAPTKDFEFPGLTPKPITVAVVKAYEKSLSCMHRGRGRPKKIDTVPDTFHHHLSQYANSRPILPNQGMSMYRSEPNMPMSDNLNMQNQLISPHNVSSSCIRPLAHSNIISRMRPNMPPPLHIPSANQFYQVMSTSPQILPVLSNNQFVTSPSQYPYMQSIVNSSQRKGFASGSFHTNTNFGNGMHHQTSKGSSDLPPGIPQPPKLQGPYPVQLSKQLPSQSAALQPSSLVVCEICDGYIKDLEQLRTHMQLIHKVKIHPKMLVSRPPLNCQKCQWRFFTDQGLERHLLGAHGLVTSNMQELANKNKDAGCCTVCGRVYASKLVAHMNQIHKVTLKPAHLSYKCTVCSATFNLYRLFENHVYLVHSGASKRPSDSSNSNPNKKLARSPDRDKSNSDATDSSKNPAEKENDLVEKKSSDELKNKELTDKKCCSCGCEIETKSSEKKHLKLDNKNQQEKCEKCLKSCGLDLRLGSNKEVK